ncbi:DUF3696 domain-containing protein [Cuspidothrix issatschenkoi LEGE 03284]|nr:DUF3696 domain-containing protein [Cuspidothrix issatschenkoi LEGE 03284]
MSHIPGGNSLQLNDIGDTSNINQLIDRVLGGMESTSTPRPPSRQELQQAIDELVPKITREVYRLIPTEREIRDDEFISSSKTRKSELTTEDLASLFVGHFTTLIQIIHDAVEDEISRLQYLGPFRTYPPRHFAFSRQKDANWEAGGGYAWDILLNNTEVRNKVNAWLGDRDRMKTPYELKVRHLFSDTEVKKTIDSGITNKLLNLTTQLMFYASGIGEPEIKEKIEQLKASLQVIGTDVEDFEQILAKLQENNFFEEIKKLTSLENNPQGHPLNGILIEIEAILSSLTDTDSLSDDWVREMTIGGDRISDLVLIDKRTDTMVSHRDVGIGISQVIPILVSCYGLSDALIAIEQPEIHLHPKLQAELGDVFIESALGEQKNTFILETHSEHLLLRIMRRMRETYNNELPEGCLPVRPEDVSVLFVEADGEGSIVREMPLNKRGELVKAWPGGFFEEELDEIF